MGEGATGGVTGWLHSGQGGVGGVLMCVGGGGGAEEAEEADDKSTVDAAHPKVVLNGGDDHARVDGEPAGDRRVNQQQDDRLEDLDDGILRAAVKVVDHHAQSQRPLATELLVVVVLGAQQVIQVLDLRLDLAHEAEALRHVGAL